MGSLPPIRQIQFQQVAGAPNWFVNFLTPLNQILGALYDTANGNTTLSDNIPALVRTVKYQVPQAGYPQYAAGGVSLVYTLRAQPKAVLLAQVQQVTPAPNAQNSSSAAIAVNQWTYSAGKIVVDSLVGLTPNATYNLTFLVL